MILLRDIPIEVNQEDVLRQLRRYGNGSCEPLATVDDVLALGRRLWNPSAVYEICEVEDIVGDFLLLYSESLHRRKSLHVGKRIELLHPASHCIVLASTIGPALDDEVLRLKKEGTSDRANLLECIGILALERLNLHLYSIVEKYASSLGWGVGPVMLPGSLSGWPVTGQREICSMLRPEKIGLEVMENGFLIPFKSSTYLIGTGPDYSDKRISFLCSECLLSSHCPWRKDR